MNAPHNTTDDSISFRATGPNSWLVWVDGDTRAITRDERGFIAWIGVQFRTWSFQGALDECAADVRHQRFLLDQQQAARRDYDRRMAKLTPAQFERVLSAREQELAGLSVNSPGRAEMLRDEIEMMREARP